MSFYFIKFNFYLKELIYWIKMAPLLVFALAQFYKKIIFFSRFFPQWFIALTLSILVRLGYHPLPLVLFLIIWGVCSVSWTWQINFSAVNKLSWTLSSCLQHIKLNNLVVFVFPHCWFVMQCKYLKYQKRCGHCKLIQISSNTGTHQQQADSWDK